MVILALVHVESGREKVDLALGIIAKAQIHMACAQVDAGGPLFIQECIHILIPYHKRCLFFFRLPTQVVALFP